MRKFLLAAFAVSVLSQSALADFDLQVTEVWPGNTAGDDLTDDWFEVTNFGDMAWTAATDGDLYFEDDSADEAKADLMSGIASIAPGESVIFVDGQPDPDDGLNTFLWGQVWNGPLTDAGRTIPQVGTYNGSGLSGTNGDAVALFLDDDTNGTLDADELLSTWRHAGNRTFPGQSFDTNLPGVVTTPLFDDDDNIVGFGNFSGAFTTAEFGVETAPNGDGETAVASPGFLPVVPEPSSLGLISVALCLIGGSSRRRK